MPIIIEEETKTEINNSQNQNPKPPKSKGAKPFSKLKNLKNKTKSIDYNVFTLILVIFSLFIAGASLTLSLIVYSKGDTPITITGQGKDGNSANFTEGSIADIAEKVSPSVVSILTETRTTGYFGQTSTSSAAGTGVIISKNGYILTNKHVISGANKISVVLANGTKYDGAQVVASDPLNDIAFIKVDTNEELQPAKLGDSKTINVGQQVIAIGNALGVFSNTVTSGIISGTGREVTATDGSYSNYETLTDLIQTDAAINAGNSGGPLVNAAGEVIGINSATSTSGSNLGFAIPIVAVKGMLSQLLETGSASRACIGVYSVTITPSVAEEYELPVTSGAYLIYGSSNKYNSSAIVKNSAAEKAGLKNKDIITSVNGIKIGKSGSLSTLIGEYKPGDTIQFSVLREGKEIAINIQLDAYAEE